MLLSIKYQALFLILSKPAFSYFTFNENTKNSRRGCFENGIENIKKCKRTTKKYFKCIIYADVKYSLTSPKKTAEEIAIELRDPFIVLAEKLEKLTQEGI